MAKVINTVVGKDKACGPRCGMVEPARPKENSKLDRMMDRGAGDGDRDDSAYKSTRAQRGGRASK